MDTEAPDFKTGYPSRGERIGPAWKVIWKSLPPRGWVVGVDMARSLAESVDLHPTTIKNLLWGACRAGHLEKKIVTKKSGKITRNVVCYQVAKKNPSA
jgi:hypothetical protein